MSQKRGKKKVNVCKVVCKVSNTADDRRLLRHVALCPDTFDSYQVIPFQTEDPCKGYILSLKCIEMVFLFFKT